MYCNIERFNFHSAVIGPTANKATCMAGVNIGCKTGLIYTQVGNNCCGVLTELLALVLPEALQRTPLSTIVPTSEHQTLFLPKRVWPRETIPVVHMTGLL